MDFILTQFGFNRFHASGIYNVEKTTKTEIRFRTLRAIVTITGYDLEIIPHEEGILRIGGIIENINLVPYD